jgi:hypothetical protein
VAAYTPVNPNLTGAAPALVAVASSDTFANNGSVILHVHNGNASTLTVTITDPTSAAPSGLAFTTAGVVVSLLTGTDKYIGPFNTNRFNDASGNVTVGYSVTSSVTAEVIDCA